MRAVALTRHAPTAHLDLDYPDAARDLNRWLPLVKWLLAMPHYVMILLLGVVTFVLVIAWFAILLTGRHPREVFDFVVGVARWTWRVHAYAILLATGPVPAVQPESVTSVGEDGRRRPATRT